MHYENHIMQTLKQQLHGRQACKQAVNQSMHRHTAGMQQANHVMQPENYSVQDSKQPVHTCISSYAQQETGHAMKQSGSAQVTCCHVFNIV
jgi:hypothetical protein